MAGMPWPGGLAPPARAIPVDLPGFGNAAGIGGYSVGAMADYVAAIVRDRAPARWFMAGHSMGAKVACVVARRAEAGEAGLAGLAGLVLLAGSPPGPEPMEEDQRQTMLGWFLGDAASRRAEAQGYIDDNVGAPLPPGPQRPGGSTGCCKRTVTPGWRGLDRGSREDWSDRVGVLQTPTLIVTGSADAALGAPRPTPGSPCRISPAPAWWTCPAPGICCRSNALPRWPG